MLHEFIIKTIKLTLINPSRIQGWNERGLSKFCYHFETNYDISMKHQPKAPNFLKDLKAKEITLVAFTHGEMRNFKVWT